MQEHQNGGAHIFITGSSSSEYKEMCKYLESYRNYNAFSKVKCKREKPRHGRCLPDGQEIKKSLSLFIYKSSYLRPSSDHCHCKKFLTSFHNSEHRIKVSTITDYSGSSFSKYHIPNTYISIILGIHTGPPS